MLLSRIIQEIRSLLQGGASEASLPFSEEHAAFMIARLRARLIKQQVDGRQTISPLLVTDYGRVAVSEQPVSALPAAWSPSVSRMTATAEMPPFIQGGRMEMVTWVGPVSDESQPWPREGQAQHSLARWRRLTCSLPAYSLRGNRITCHRIPPQMDAIRVMGVAEDPLAARRWIAAKDGVLERVLLEGYDFEYPMPASMVDAALSLASEREMRMLAASAAMAQEGGVA